jgi:competence protein ComEC
MLNCDTEDNTLDASLVLGLAAVAGGLVVAAPVESAVATSVVLLALAWRGARLLAIAAALAFFVTAARAGSVVQAHEHARVATVESGRWPARCEVSGTVARSPILLGDRRKIDVDVTSGTCDGRPVHGRATLHAPNELAWSIARGDTVEAVAQLAPVSLFWNADTGDPRPAQARRGILLSGGAEDIVRRQPGSGLFAIIDHLRERFRARILATFPASTAAMARALVLGEDDLTDGERSDFRRSGLAHLLAVSGMHLVLVVASFVATLRAVLVRIPFVATRWVPVRLASLVGIPMAWIYADLAGGSGSAFRAAWMSSLALLVHVTARRLDTWRAFGLSVGAMALFDPLVGFDVSFALSAAATAGLLGLGGTFSKALTDRTPAYGAPVARALATSAAASIACAPLLACITPELPFVGLVANLIAVPLGELAALPLCLGHALLEPLPAAEHGCAVVASGALELVRRIAHESAAVSWGTIRIPTPTAGQLAAISMGVMGCSGAVTSHKKTWVASAALACLVLEFEVRARGSPTGGLRVTYLDVGQGDSAIVDLPDGSAILIDAGGFVGSPIDTGDRVLAPVFRARRRHAVALAVLSHPHPDHFGGLRRGLANVTLEAFWDTGQGELEGAGKDYAALLRSLRERGVRVSRPSDLCGIHKIGGATVEVLAPCPGLTPDRGANDNSFVLRITYGERSFLFVGDAEHAEEEDLAKLAPEALRADVLKVGHHGSRTSTSEAFLQAVAPSIAVISCGIRNRFGHPAKVTLATFAKSSARLLRTDRDGSVTVTTDGHSLNVETANP